MKNIKTLTATILLGIGLLVGGCGNQQPSTHQQNKQICTYNKVDLKDMGSYSASNPIMDKGMTFNFNNAVQFNSKKVDVVDNKKVIYATVAKDENLCLYEIDVTDKQGWKKLENTNNVYQVDYVEHAQSSAFDVYNMGIAVDCDLNKIVNVTYIKGHIVHTHTKECK